MLTAIITGFLGSLHCVGMCGSLVLALKTRYWYQSVLYHLGRSLMYALLGLLFGLFGRGLYLAGFQQYLSVFLGIVMIIFVLLPQQNFPFLYKIYQQTRNYFNPLQQQNKHFSIFILGFLNGLLPCGLVYAAIFAAISTANAGYGALYMFLFGLGTMPLLLILGLTHKTLPMAWRTNLLKIVPFFIVLVGILLIMRGLDLGIPYVSPHFAPYIIACCHL
jgi:sulfite exporter TauE/SafE